MTQVGHTALVLLIRQNLALHRRIPYAVKSLELSIQIGPSPKQHLMLQFNDLITVLDNTNAFAMKFTAK